MSDMVSVVLIFHNEAAFLDEAIRSVREQSWERWELLLVDDGSRDASPAIAKAAAAADPARIRYLTHPDGGNHGMSASRNLGIFAAQGAHVAFLDGDDVYLPERLRRHVEILENFPGIAMVQSDHVRWRSWAGDTVDERHDLVRPFLALGDQVLWPPLGLQRILLVPFLVAGICNITVRREVATGVGGFVDAFASLFEDQAFVARVSLRHPVYVLQEYLARYRHHPGSATRRLKEKGAAGSLVTDGYARDYWDWVVELLEEHGGPEMTEVISLARARRARLEPSTLRRIRLVLAGAAKRALRMLLPARGYERLLDLDYAGNEREGRRDYRRTADAMTLRAKARAAEAKARPASADGAPVGAADGASGGAATHASEGAGAAEAREASGTAEAAGRNARTAERI